MNWRTARADKDRIQQEKERKINEIELERMINELTDSDKAIHDKWLMVRGKRRRTITTICHSQHRTI